MSEGKLVPEYEPWRQRRIMVLTLKFGTLLFKQNPFIHTKIDCLEITTSNCRLKGIFKFILSWLFKKKCVG